MANQTEAKHPFGFVVWETLSDYCREQITILAGSGSDRVLTAGQALARIFAGTATAAAGAGNTGDGTMGAITVSALAKDGNYSLIIGEAIANAGSFEVRDPDGEFVGVGDVAAAFSAGGLAFTLADGSADFLAGDVFTITVVQTGIKYIAYDQDVAAEAVLAGYLGAGITALNGVDNLGGVALLRGPAIVKAAEVSFPSDITAGELVDVKQESLHELGIIVR